MRGRGECCMREAKGKDRKKKSNCQKQILSSLFPTAVHEMSCSENRDCKVVIKHTTKQQMCCKTTLIFQCQEPGVCHPVVAPWGFFSTQKSGNLTRHRDRKSSRVLLAKSESKLDFRGEVLTPGWCGMYLCPSTVHWGAALLKAL